MGAVSKIPLTFIIPTYNRPRSTAVAIASVLQQRLEIAEIIVVDDGSDEPFSLSGAGFAATDNIRIIRHPENRGAAAARNTGLRAAETDWISFLDSDDRLEEGSLGPRWQALVDDQLRRSDPQVIYGCAWIEVDTADLPLAVRCPRSAQRSSQFAEGCWFSPGSCIIINGRQAVAAIGFQDESLPRLEDFDWFFALGQKGFRLKTISTVGARLRRDRRIFPERVEESVRLLKAKWFGKAADLGPALTSRMSAYLALELAAAHFFARNRPRAAFWFIRSIMARPRLKLHLSPGWVTLPPPNRSAG